MKPSTHHVSLFFKRFSNCTRTSIVQYHSPQLPLLIKNFHCIPKMASIKNIVQRMEPRTSPPSRSVAALPFCAILLSLVLMFLFISSSSSWLSFNEYSNQLRSRVCDEIYVVREGETLHSISDKCGDPFIIEQNPHIHDSDDVFPGLVIKITPASNSLY